MLPRLPPLTLADLAAFWSVSLVSVLGVATVFVLAVLWILRSTRPGSGIR
jgi:hypothetical protein